MVIINNGKGIPTECTGRLTNVRKRADRCFGILKLYVHEPWAALDSNATCVQIFSNADVIATVLKEQYVSEH